MQRTPLLRPGRKEDAEALARLAEIASEGIAPYFWAQSAAADETPLAVGIDRAQREEGAFSYRNATVAEVDGKVAGALIGYRLPDPYETGDLGLLPPIIRPLIELEAHAPGSWYVNILAAFPEHRGKGLGTILLAEAERIADAAGIKQLSLIVADENDGAERLYRRTGFVEVARRPLVGFPGFARAGDWILLIKPVA